MKAVYVTDSYIASSGHGGSVVSFHELKALTRVDGNPQIYQRVGKLFFEQYYRIPFLYDYYIASLLSKPEEVELAHFYGASFNLTSKLLSHARKFATVPAHNLEVSLQEWASFGYWQPPPPHLTDDAVFRYLVHGLRDLTVVCPSTESAKYLKAKLNLDSVIIPHGTDLPEHYNTEKREFKAFHLSAFGPDKGQVYLFKAWKLLQTRVPQTMRAANLTVCCSNIADAMLKDIPNVTVNHWVKEEEKATLYNEASVYVQPSVTEGWGLTVGEAMSYGVPVIVTEGVGAKDMVEEGKNGFIVPIRSPEKIAEFLQYFYDNPSEVKKMGNSARLKAQEYAWENIEEKYVKLWTA